MLLKYIKSMQACTSGDPRMVSQNENQNESLIANE